MALGFAVTNRHHANALTGGRINWELFYELTTYLGRLRGGSTGRSSPPTARRSGSSGLSSKTARRPITTRTIPPTAAASRASAPKSLPGSDASLDQPNSLAGKREALLLWTESQAQLIPAKTDQPNEPPDDSRNPHGYLARPNQTSE